MPKKIELLYDEETRQVQVKAENTTLFEVAGIISLVTSSLGGTGKKYQSENENVDITIQT